MKALLFTLTALMAISCVGCKDGDNGQPNENAVSLSITTAGSTPGEHMVQSGDSDVHVATFTFRASNVDAVTITGLRLYQAVAGGDAAVSLVKLRVGGSVIASGTLFAGSVVWENLTISVPKGDTLNVEVLLSFNTSQAIIDIAGKSVRMVIRNVEDDWDPAGISSAPNGVLNGVNETGDLRAEGQTSGTVLINSTDADADQLRGDNEYGDNQLDSVGHISNGGNALTKTQHLTNSVLGAELAFDNPTGSQGAATGSDADIFRFELSASANGTSSNPRWVFVSQIVITIVGDAEADQFELYGPSDSVNPMATSATIHATTKSGGDPSVAADHISVLTEVTFVLTGSDRFIDFGQTKAYNVRARVYAVTDSEKPIRSLRPSIASYGNSQTAGDVKWSENGDPSVDTNSHTWEWIDDASGRAQLQPSTPLRYTGTSFIP
jgi:hypothetical protein